MYLANLEDKFSKDTNFQFYESSFQIEDLQNLNDYNTQRTIKNLLTSNNVCMMTWVLYNLQDTFDISFEEIFLELLKNENVYISLKSCEILTRLYSHGIPNDAYFLFVKQNINSDSYELIEQLLTFLCEILYNKLDSLKIIGNQIFDRNQVKVKFCEDSTFIEILKKYIKIGELQYKIVKIILILSFNEKCTRILEENRLIEEITNIISERTREKIMRVCACIVRNVIEHGTKFTILKSNTLIEICNGTYNDEEMIIDMKFIKNKIEYNLKIASLIDIYFDELFGGKLEPSPYHYNDKFWESNHLVLSENKVEIIKALKKYLKATSPSLVCVAANDLYRFLKIVPEVFSFMKKYGIKEDLFTLTHSENEDIRFYAIQTLSTCIFSEWIVKEGK